jgi:hypothetical protein
LASQPRRQLLSEANPSFLSCLSALYFLPVRELSATEIRAVGYGQAIEGNEQEPVCLSDRGRLVAVYGPSATAGRLRPLVVLA